MSHVESSCVDVNSTSTSTDTTTTKKDDLNDSASHSTSEAVREEGERGIIDDRPDDDHDDDQLPPLVPEVFVGDANGSVDECEHIDDSTVMNNHQTGDQNDKTDKETNNGNELTGSSVVFGGVPAATPSPEPASLMEWNWNPVRMFVSRLQNLSAMRPQATTFDFLPKLSFPSFSWGWWGGSQDNPPEPDKMNDGDGDGEDVEKMKGEEEDVKIEKEREEKESDKKEQAVAVAKKESSSGGGMFIFRGFFGGSSHKEEEDVVQQKRKKNRDDDDLYSSEDDYDDDDDMVDDSDEDDDLFLFGNMPVNPRVPGYKSKSRLFMDKYSQKQIWSVFKEKRFKAGKCAGHTFEEVFRSKGIDCVAIDIDTSDPFVHKINLYGAPYEELQRNNEIEAKRKKEQLLSIRASKGLTGSLDDDDNGSDDESKDDIGDDDDDDGENKKEKKRRKLIPPFVPHNLMVQFFVRRDTSFSVMETKSFTTTETGVPAYYANAFSEGIKYLRGYFGQKRLQMLVIEWLRLQNPRLSFGERMPLPGQMHPGLGIGSEIDSILVGMAIDSHRDGILNLPEHWYNAYLYTKSSRPYKFMNPAFQGYFQSICDALENDIRTRGLPAVAWAIFRGMLRCRPISGDASFVPAFITNTFAAFKNDTDGKKKEKECSTQKDDGSSSKEEIVQTQTPAAEDAVIKWVSQEQVCPLSWQMSYYFASPSYANVVRKYYHPEAFYIVWDDHDTTASPSSQTTDQTEHLSAS